MTFLQDVRRLLDDYGYDVTITKPDVGGSYNITTGKFTGGTDTGYTARGAWMNYHNSDIDGTNIRAGDRKLLISAYDLDITPAVGDYVDSEVRIIDVHTHETNEGVVAYICQTRG